MISTTRNQSALDRGQTDRISLTFDLDFGLLVWFRPSISCELWSFPSHVQKFKVNGQSVQMIEWKQTDGRIDGGDYITWLNNAVGKYITVRCRWSSLL